MNAFPLVRCPVCGCLSLIGVEGCACSEALKEALEQDDREVE